MKELHVSITAEKLFQIGPLTVTNSLLSSWIIVLLLIFIALKTSRSLKKRPSLIQLLIEIPINGLYGLTKNVAGPKASLFFPYIATFFFYIIFSNWSGLVPGVGTISWHHVPILRAPSADLNMTIALALTSVGIIQCFGLKTLGSQYLKKFFNFRNPINTFVGLLELISEFAKIISFAFRLFGNIFAGEVLLVVIAFLIPVIAPIPFYGLELFVGFIQALVFAILTLVFLNMATTHQQH